MALLSRLVKTLITAVIHTLMAVLFVGLVVPILWVALRIRSASRSAAVRVVFGPVPIINSKYHSAALQQQGVDSMTVVRGWYAVYSRDDFDQVFGVADSSVPRWRRWYVHLLEGYIVFARLLWGRTVFVYFFEGLYLGSYWPSRVLEIPVLKLLGKKIVVTHYGGDIVTASGTRDAALQHAYTQEYPHAARNEHKTRRRIDYMTRRADAVIGGGGLGADHLPRIEYMSSSPLCLPEAEWTPTYGPSRAVGDPMRVLHAPNHRLIKGTSFLTDAIDSLRGDGLNIELVLLEGVRNEEVKRIMGESHVVAEQFLLGWHGLTAIEAMASGKPVLCYLRADILRLYTLTSFAGECPIVNTSPEQIADKLRWLYENPEECEEIGRKGRAYVEKYHSLEAIGGYLSGIIGQICNDVPSSSGREPTGHATS